MTNAEGIFLQPYVAQQTVRPKGNSPVEPYKDALYLYATLKSVL